MCQGRPVCQVIDEQKRVNLGQSEEQQQREPDPRSDRLEIQADAEEEEQYGAERLMSPEIAKHFLIRLSAAAFRVTARILDNRVGLSAASQRFKPAETHRIISAGPA